MPNNIGVIVIYFASNTYLQILDDVEYGASKVVQVQGRLVGDLEGVQ